MQGLYGGRGPHAVPLAGLVESDGEYIGGMGYSRTHGSGGHDLQPLGSDKLWCSVMRQREQARATVGASDDDIFGQTIQPALNHIEYIPIAHSCGCAKETSQLGTGELWCCRNAEICAPKSPDPI